jgi:hypothetical protein
MRRLGLGALGLIGASFGIATACIDPDANFVYTARPYDPADMCVGPYVELELVQGSGGDSRCTSPEAGRSGPGLACLVSNSGAVYVSSVCPPYPPDYDTSGTNPACGAAIAAMANGVICEATDAALDASDAASSTPDGAPSGVSGGDAGGSPH